MHHDRHLEHIHTNARAFCLDGLFNTTIIKLTPKKDEVLFKGQRKCREEQSKTDEMNVSI